jgi:DNA polymerase beta
MSDNDDGDDDERSDGSGKKRALPAETDAKRAKVLASGAAYFATRSPLAGVMAGAHVNLNEQLTDILTQLGVNEKNSGNIVKANAYVKAVNSIKLHPKRLESGAEAQRLDGVGKKIALKIDEIIATGQLAKLESAKVDPKQVALNTLTAVHGVGPVTAKTWFAQGITTIDALQRAVADGSVKLTHEQTLGLRYLDAFAVKIPRAEMDQHAALIRATAARVDATLRCEIVGSYRRGVAQSGDVDVLLMHESYGRAEHQSKLKSPFVKRLVEELERAAYITDTLNHGASKFSGVVHLGADGAPRKIDIKIFPKEAYPFALLHFTGSGEMNRQMRAVALGKRLTLSEHGLQAVGQTGEKGDWIDLPDERAIFELLGVAFLQPNERSL